MRPIVLCLYSYSGVAARPWLDAGFTVVSVDLKHPDGWSAPDYMREPHYCYGGSALDSFEDMLHLCSWRVAFVIGFPPCTDLAVSGAKHFKRKAEENPGFQEDAMRLVKRCASFGAPYIFENPVSRISTLWRKPDAIVQPWHYSAHIPEEHAQHPRYPDVIPPRDHYNKTTCLWVGNGASLPVRAPHPLGGPEEGAYPGWQKLGGKSERTKTIRSETPRGLAHGIFLANQHFLARSHENNA